MSEQSRGIEDTEDRRLDDMLLPDVPPEAQGFRRCTFMRLGTLVQMLGPEEAEKVFNEPNPIAEARELTALHMSTRGRLDFLT